MTTNSEASQALSNLMADGLHKDPTLADKQRRLLTTLSSATSSKPRADSSDSTTPAVKALPSVAELQRSRPAMSQYASREDYEEALGRWQENQGKILALAAKLQ